MENKDMPAMPLVLKTCAYDDGDVRVDDAYEGLTKREMFAIHLMSAYRTQHQVLDAKPNHVAEWAVDDADALLAELDK